MPTTQKERLVRFTDCNGISYLYITNATNKMLEDAIEKMHHKRHISTYDYVSDEELVQEELQKKSKIFERAKVEEFNW